MSSLPVVEYLNILEDCAPVRGVGLKRARQLGLERGKEALGHGVVPAVALAAHARHQALAFKGPSVLAGRVLRAAVRMVDEPRRRLPGERRHLQGADRQVAVDAVRHGPADDLPRVEGRAGVRRRFTLTFWPSPNPTGRRTGHDGAGGLLTGPAQSISITRIA